MHYTRARSSIVVVRGGGSSAFAPPITAIRACLVIIGVFFSRPERRMSHKDKAAQPNVWKGEQR